MPSPYWHGMEPYVNFTLGEWPWESKGETMAEFSEHQVTRAVEAYCLTMTGLTPEQACKDSAIRVGLMAAAKHLQLPWLEPTTIELDGITWTSLREAITKFVQRRNNRYREPEKHLVDPRKERVMDLLLEFEAMAKGRSASTSIGDRMGYINRILAAVDEVNRFQFGVTGFTELAEPDKSMYREMLDKR